MTLTTEQELEVALDDLARAEAELHRRQNAVVEHRLTDPDLNRHAIQHARWRVIELKAEVIQLREQIEKDAA